MRLLIARHAETEHNANGLTQGRADNALSARGLAQAAALAAFLAETPLGAIYSSPLRRALQTAEPLAAAHGLEIVSEPALMEMDVGEMEGLSGAQMRARFPDLLSAWRAEQAAESPLPGGESLAQVQARAWAFLDSLQPATRSGTILCVTHNFVALALVCRVLNLPLGRLGRLRQGLAALTSIDFQPGRTQVLQLNEDCHLRDT